MPCACNAGKFVYTNSSGSSSTFNSKVEALAAQRRAGGGGTVKPKS